MPWHAPFPEWWVMSTEDLRAQAPDTDSVSPQRASSASSESSFFSCMACVCLDCICKLFIYILLQRS